MSFSRPKEINVPSVEGKARAHVIWGGNGFEKKALSIHTMGIDTVSSSLRRFWDMFPLIGCKIMYLEKE